MPIDLGPYPDAKYPVVAWIFCAKKISNMDTYNFFLNITLFPELIAHTYTINRHKPCLIQTQTIFKN